jgi:hypothetical protein
MGIATGLPAVRLLLSAGLLPVPKRQLRGPVRELRGDTTIPAVAAGIGPARMSTIS